ncbi:MAG: hypothetical protein LBB88_12220 [Planctomycetaceae bacterium]|jgi:hypothetical protein|nr:hypothetical protein [Planctomycetaceae bacterium]
MISVSLNYNRSDANISSDITADVQVDLLENDIPIISGGWQCSIRRNGKSLCRISDWQENYLQSDDENIGCELIEIESELDNNFRLRRFLLLDTVNQIFIAGDVVSCSKGVKRIREVELQYESSFIYSDMLQAAPLSRGGKSDIIFRPYSNLRGQLKPLSFRVIPFALSSVRFLRAIDGRICLSQDCCCGLSIFAPLFFDFKLSRISKPAIWRELTVGENMEKVTSDNAVGYRIKIDKDQFLIYYSLTSPANRTLLGHNLIDSICYAKFDPKSGVNPLLTK